MSHVLDVLEAAPDDPALQAAMAERGAHLAECGEGEWYQSTGVAELVLAHRLQHGPALSPYLAQVAQEQDLCRRTREAQFACKRLVTVGETCSAECPIAKFRIDAMRASQRREHAFVTDWYMPEAHALIDPAVEVPTASH